MKKTKQWVAAAIVASMMMSQTVYAQEYTEPVETTETLSAAEETVVESDSEKNSEAEADYAAEYEEEDAAAEAETALVEIYEGSNTVEITEGGSMPCVSFVPQESGIYDIYSTGDDDTKAALYDESMSPITDNDDGGENTNFKITYRLEAGQTYYIAVGYYNSSMIGEITFMVQKATNLCGDNATWSVGEDGTLTIQGEGSLYEYNNDEPWRGQTIRKIVIGEGITDLNTTTFQNSYDLESVEVPSTLKNIPAYCFYNCGLKTVYIANGVESIGDSAFVYCRNLKKVEIPSSVITFGSNIFGGCSENLYIMGEVGSEAESYANANGITFVDTYNPVIPLKNCTVTLAQTTMAYNGAEREPKVTVSDGDNVLTKDEDYTVTYTNNQNVGTASVTVTGNGTTYSGEVTLEFQIVEVTDLLTEGENYVRVLTNDENGQVRYNFQPEEDGFYIFKVDLLGNNDLSVNSKGFLSRTSWTNDELKIVSLEKLSADNENYYFSIGSNTEIDTAVKITIEKVETSGKINGVTWELSDDAVLTVDGTDLEQAKTDGSHAYAWSSFQDVAQKIVIGSKVTTIPYYAFEEFSNITSLELPEGLSEIQGSAFSECTQLKNVKLPSSLKKIGSYAFSKCGLKGIEIPESVEKISEYAVGSGSGSTMIENFYIIGKSGSAAEDYANEYNLIFIDKDAQEIPLGLCEITVPKTAEYTGAAVEPEVSVSFNGEELTEGTDYELVYSNNTSAGTGTVEVRGLGKYSGTESRNFKIIEFKTYEQTICPSTYYVDIDSDYGEDWNIDDINEEINVINSDSTVCTVEHIKTSGTADEDNIQMTFKVTGLKKGESNFSIQDSKGNLLFKYHVVVNDYPENAVIFEDPLFNAKMMESYDTDHKGYLTEQDMANIRKINLNEFYRDGKIKSFKGLEKAVNLVSVDVVEVYNADVTILKELPNLEDVTFESSKVTDLNWMTDLKAMKRLDISRASVKSYDGIEKLTNLEKLYLYDYEAENADAFKNYKNLRVLSWEHPGNLSDVSTLSGLDTLEDLSIWNASNLTDVECLKQIKNLDTLWLLGTGLSDEDLWKFAAVKDMTLNPGESKWVAGYYKLLGEQVEILDGEDCIAVSSDNWGAAVVALKKGTAKLRVTYSPSGDSDQVFTKDITVTITDQTNNEEVGVDYKGSLNVSVDESKDSDGKAYILDSNGALWQTTPELEKVKEGIKKYIRDYEYVQLGQTKKYYEYYLDGQNTLWNGQDEKVAENIITFEKGFAIDKTGNFYDLHSDFPKAIKDVVKWAVSDKFAYLLKSDGTLWWKSVCMQKYDFEKIPH